MSLSSDTQAKQQPRIVAQEETAGIKAMIVHWNECVIFPMLTVNFSRGWLEPALNECKIFCYRFGTPRWFKNIT
ncbi:hypothetical protein AB205_0137720 [Aquarana catesbeiana]|uniref:Uncharacterized protein n=1 Tax=Aquarana catesbeiana TaxID=8400 RepID=A0A2G9P831_AQUCT|nr:hypothetical protein AB205_0137720 [Aquarana catesbeiana]